MYMNEAQSVPVVPDASLYPHVSILSFILVKIHIANHPAPKSSAHSPIPLRPIL